MKQAFDFSEHQADVAAALPYDGRAPAEKREPRKAVGAAYHNAEFWDWIIEDANGKLYTPDDDFNSFAGMVRFCHQAEKPCRISLAIHGKGDGIAFHSKRKTRVEKPETHVWFFDLPDEEDTRPHHQQDVPQRNLDSGMPPTMWCGLYGVSTNSVRKRIQAGTLKRKTILKGER